MARPYKDRPVRFFNPGKDYFDRLELKYQLTTVPLIDKVISSTLATLGILLIFAGIWGGTTLGELWTENRPKIYAKAYKMSLKITTFQGFRQPIWPMPAWTKSQSKSRNPSR